MQILKSLLGKKPLSPDLAGEELLAWAKAGMRPEGITAITDDPQITQALTSLIFLTKSAIIVSLLRREAGDGQANCRPYLVADAFEKRLFQSVPPEEHAQLTECIMGLVAMTKELDGSMRRASIGKADIDEFGKEITQWCKTWLSTISDDEDFLARTSLLFGGPLSIYIHSQIASLESSVISALYEKK